MSDTMGKHVQLQGGFAFKSSDFKESGIPLIRISNVTANGLNKSDLVFLPEEFADELKDFIIKENDTLIAMSGATTGKCCLIKSKDVPGLINQRVGRFIVLNEKETDKLYIFHVVNSTKFKDELLKDAFGSAQPNVSPRDIENIKWNFPSINEQHRIAQILSTCDTVIEKTQAAIAKYKTIKQGMLHDLFTRGVVSEKVKVKSEKGEWMVKETWKLRLRYEDAPELYKDSKLGWIPREWEVKELGDIGEVRMCRRIFNFETSDQGDIPFFKIGTFGKQPDAYISEELYNSYRQRFSFPKKGEILISAAGTIGRTLIYDGAPSYYQDSNIVWIDNNENLISNKYLYQVFQIVAYKTEGGTIQRLYNSILKSALFPCPSKPEQRLITERLNSIDNKLQSEQSYLEKLQQLKKGLMEDLLSGRKRVKILT